MHGILGGFLGELHSIPTKNIHKHEVKSCVFRTKTKSMRKVLRFVGYTEQITVEFIKMWNGKKINTSSKKSEFLGSL